MQKGIMSFFSPKSGKGSPKGEAGHASHSSTTEKRALGDSNSDSPLKRRVGMKRRVLRDSDSENDESEEGKLPVPEQTPTSKSEESESGKEASSPAQLEVMASPNKSPASSLSIRSPLKTPPKRATARKHTGKRARPIDSSVSGKAKRARLEESKLTKCEKELVRSVKSGEDSHVLSSELQERTKEAAETESDNMEEEEVDKMICDSKEGEPSCAEKMLVEESEPVEDMAVQQQESTPERVKEEATPKKSVVKKIHPFFSSSPKNEPASKESACTRKGGTIYDPSQKNYHPVEDACWKRGQKVPYLAIAKTFQSIETTSKRLQIINILSNFLRSVIALSPEDTVKCVYLSLNKLAPAYEGLELGVGESILIKALCSATGRSVDRIKSEVAEKGDLGLVAESSRSNQRTMFSLPPLTVPGVYDKLKDIASLKGSASQSKKVDMITKMFVSCRDCEARYLIRSLGGKLRIGLAEQSVLIALAHAVVYTPPSSEWPLAEVDASRGKSASEFKKELEAAALAVKNAYCEMPSYDVLLPALLKHGISDLHRHYHLTPGIPLKPMLANPTKGVQEVLKRFDQAEFTSEWKYDGERAQIHVLNGERVEVYSRNQENNTSKYPDIIARIPRVLKEGVQSCIIDAEAVAWDVENSQILPFQVLSTRKKKDADLSTIKVQVCIFAFDLLYLNGEPLVREPLRRRRELLRSSLNVIEGEFMFAKSMDSSNVEDIEEFMEDALKGSCEGLMVKTLDKDASYEIAKRSHNWLKLKKDYLEGVGDTLDLVVIGGFHGTGKRTGRYGGFLLACYDTDNEEFQAVCKIGTGFKDEDLEQHTEFFKDHVIEGPKLYYRLGDGPQPDHWFDAVQVWEVKAADLSISPVYPAASGIVDPEKGISLRFPRFLRIREDKKSEDATSSNQVAEMYQNQQNKGGSTVHSSSHQPSSSLPNSPRSSPEPVDS